MTQKKTTRRDISSKQEKVTDMNLLFVVRHGDYDRDRNLSSLGADSIHELSNQLRNFINGEKILILSSPAPRAFQSAKIISEKLGVPVEEHEILWSDSDHLPDLDGLLEIIKERKTEAEVIILVTHFEYVEIFPGYFARNELGIDNVCPPVPSKGEACLIDCTNKRLRLIY